MRADLIIVGAGMVGSALALALQEQGLDILLIDGGPLSVKPFDPVAPFEPRVSALSIASQRVLERLGVWQGIAARRSSPYAHHPTFHKHTNNPQTSIHHHISAAPSTAPKRSTPGCTVHFPCKTSLCTRVSSDRLISF